MATKKATSKTTAAAKKPRAQPVRYSDELALEFCERVAAGRTVADVCRDPDMPHWSTVYDWMEAHEVFDRGVARAREVAAGILEAELLQIADETAFDTVETDHGLKADKEWIARSKLRVETRQWLLQKTAPRLYGDKRQVEHQGGVSINVVTGVPDGDE